MTSKTLSLDDLWTLVRAGRDPDTGQLHITENKFRAAILAWAESKAPEERPQTKYLGKRHSLVQGWNNGIKQYKSNLRSKS